MPDKKDKIDKTYFELCPDNGENYYRIDDFTCGDLSLDEVFHKIDTTKTTPGRSVLYFWLRKQCRGSESLKKRTDLADFFIKRKPTMELVQKILAKIGKQHRGDLADEIWNDPGDKYMEYKRPFYAYFISMIAIIAAFAALGLSVLLVIIIFAIINIYIFSRTTKYISAHSQSIFYLGSMLSALKKLANAIPEGFDISEAKELAELHAISRNIPRQARMFQSTMSVGGDILDMMIGYLRIFMLGELRAYFKFYRAFLKYRDEIERIYILIGSLDAAVALSKIRESENVCLCLPEDEVQRAFATKIAHPLLENCAVNDIQCDKNIVITGANMSGKTTFLRTMGINQILATTMGFAYAQKFETSFFHTVTAINIKDDLARGKSRYLVEAERLLYVINQCEDHPSLALIDEILTGTNSRDRISAAISILQFLNESDSLILSTTHDLEIAESLSGTYDTYYFAEDTDTGDLTFDYRLNRGIIDRRNALEILRRLGFSKYVTIN